MRLVGLERRQPTISLSALVDVLFILIVFVILAADFDRTRVLDVELPASSEGAALATDRVELVVPLAGPMRVGGAVIADDELDARLAKARRGARELVIAADGGLALERAVALIEAAKRAGFATVSIATRSEAR